MPNASEKEKAKEGTERWVLQPVWLRGTHKDVQKWMGLPVAQARKVFLCARDELQLGTLPRKRRR